METGNGQGAGIAEGEPVWIGLPPGLLRMRRLLLVVWLGLLAVAVGVLLNLFAISMRNRLRRKYATAAV